MSDRWVLDASVAGAYFFPEQWSDAANAFFRSAPPLAAPDLIFAELASLAAKKVRRGEAPLRESVSAVTALRELLSDIEPCAGLAPRAFNLAAVHGFSAYDALYLALAEAEDTFVVTADARLVQRAQAVGLSTLVRLLGESPPRESAS